jgi:hypothetical protein
MADVALSPEEIARRGQEYYDRSLRDRLEPKHKGAFLVLNVETGEYEMDKDESLALQRAVARWPGTVFYTLRVGYRAVGHMGFPGRCNKARSH